MNALQRHRKLDAIWASDKGFRGWFNTVSHTDLGRMFLVTAFFYFGVAGVLSMLIRAQLATPHSAWASEEVYAQLFTMHGTIMMFLFAIPAIEGMAVYLIPKMLGTRDLAYPRLTAYGYWCYAFGGAMMLASLVLGLAPDGGWFMYPPLTGGIHSPGINTDFWLIGITFVEISAICAAVELCVSILKFRAPGMSLDKMPIFGWYILVTSLMILTGFPPLILGSILLELERAFGLPFFQAELGGDSLLWQHLFWLFGHPEVYIIFLPAAGILSTLIPVMARTTLLGYGWIVASVVALAFLSFGLWVHHMFTTGIPHMGVAFFSAASTLVAVPTAVQLFAWIGTMWKGRPELHMPMLHILGFFITFVIGGLTGVMVAIVPFDWQVHDTAFITAHLHYVLFGGFVFPILAGLYYWLPLVTGRKRFFKLGETAFVLIFTGFHGTFLAMHVLGLLGQRRRIHTYDVDAGWTAINLTASVFSFIMAIGLALVLIDIIIHLFIAVRGARSPWGAGTLEWATMSPPPSYNFASLPHVTSRAPYTDNPTLPDEMARGLGYLSDPQEGRRETLMIDVTSGTPEAVVVYPANTFLPIKMAAVTGVFFLSLLLKVYWITPLAVIGVAALAWRWAWQLGARNDAGPQPVGRDMYLPLSSETAKSQGWWGSAFLLVANATFFGSLLFGYAFLWTIAPGWPPPVWLDLWLPELAFGIAAALAAPILIRMTCARVAGGQAAAAPCTMALVAVVVLAVCLASLMLRTPDPSMHAYGATLLVLGGYGFFHAAVTGVMLGFLRARIAKGHTSQARRAEPAIVRLWVDYTAAVGILCLTIAHLPALLT
ncbi:Cytochrome c oxidase polypeptide I [Sulfitobacter noctilucae]|uniref:cbb3-type cytochrome c oxidase subunit I n=1 Tax=Sulfitobacter noctilucae TaxID=1342302 RepID=UPI00046A6CC8|nr:cbb3-type cytochrome c oxidase subunit I [Sulfitobacter noctilucae]KIN70577.1 Cytochrome c oxidase polypeptide I [Sulfitobacter noctilucae]